MTSSDKAAAQLATPVDFLIDQLYAEKRLSTRPMTISVLGHAIAAIEVLQAENAKLREDGEKMRRWISDCDCDHTQGCEHCDILSSPHHSYPTEE